MSQIITYSELFFFSKGCNKDNDFSWKEEELQLSNAQCSGLDKKGPKGSYIQIFASSGITVEGKLSSALVRGGSHWEWTSRSQKPISDSVSLSFTAFYLWTRSKLS